MRNLRSGNIPLFSQEPSQYAACFSRVKYNSSYVNPILVPLFLALVFRRCRQSTVFQNNYRRGLKSGSPSTRKLYYRKELADQCLVGTTILRSLSPTHASYHKGASMFALKSRRLIMQWRPAVPNVLTKVAYPACDGFVGHEMAANIEIFVY